MSVKVKYNWKKDYQNQLAKDNAPKFSKSPWKINPEWKAYNDLYNEGGEGFNPHKK